jgi:hypothetical protein
MAAYSFQPSDRRLLSQSITGKQDEFCCASPVPRRAGCRSARGAGREAVQENTKESEVEPDVTPFDIRPAFPLRSNNAGESPVLSHHAINGW